MPQRRILIADDEAYLTQIVTFNLERIGDKVIVADDGEAALRLAMEHVPDLVISDYQMPLLDGLSLSIRLRQEPRTAHIPVLMLTGRGHLIAPADMARTNIRMLLPKPFSSRELMTKLEEILGSTASGGIRQAG